MVKHFLSDSILTELMENIEKTLGLHFPQEKWNDLERALMSIYAELDYINIETLAKRIIDNEISKEEVEILAAALTVGETYFFREPNSLNAFEYNIIPELIKSGEAKGRRLRIWSAGCATGEEPYTIAMILKRSIPEIEDWDITILATDINVKFIGKALSGNYTRWSFRDVPQWITNKYFITKNENHFVLSDEIKKMVTFAYLNLREDNYPSVLNDTNAMDVIFCRNVLMYFSEDNIRKVVKKFQNSLKEGGYLIVSQTELSEYYFHDFQSIPSSGSIIYKKDSCKKPAAAYVPPVLPLTDKKQSVKFKQNAAEISVYDNKTLIRKNTLPEKGDKFLPLNNDIEGIKKLYESGNYDEAVSKLIPYLSAGNRNPEAFSILARIYANKGMLDEAEKYCSEAVDIDNLNPGYHFLLASIYKETGSAADAVSELRKAVYLNAGFVMAYYTMGIIATAQNNRKDAVRNLDTALSLLKKYGPDEYVPESEGIPAGRLTEIIETVKMRL